MSARQNADPAARGASPDALRERRALLDAIAPFQVPSPRQSAWQFASTLGAYLAVNAAMYVACGLSTWLTLALAVPAAGLVVRLFIVQHDCGHGAFFRSRTANVVVGRLCSPITFTPYAFWRRQHANHHASFNNLDRRDTGLDIYSSCVTLAEYEALSRSRRLLYRLSRHPVVTQFLLPPIVFLVLYRIPFDTSDSWKRERHSVYLTNLAIAAVLACLVAAFGVAPVAMVQLPIMVVASIVGVWLFTVQHRFEEAQWMRQEQWTAVGAALEGSSYLKLPRVLQWFTGNIGFHHIHHLSARVPNYRLQACHEAIPALANVTTLSFRDAMRAPFFALWDETFGRMTHFPSRTG